MAKAKSWRGPTNKLIWTCAHQKQAIAYGFFVGVRIDIQHTPYGDDKFERAKLNRLIGNLTKPMLESMLNAGLAAEDEFWLHLNAFLNQQEHMGYVGAWEERARSFIGMKHHQASDQNARLHRMHPETRAKRDAEAFRREYQSTLASVTPTHTGPTLQTERYPTQDEMNAFGHQLMRERMIGDHKLKPNNRLT